MDAEYLDFFSKDKRNILFALKFSQPKEIKKIKKLCSEVVRGKIEIGSKDIKKLKKHKTFLRKFVEGKATRQALTQEKNCKAISNLIRIYMKNIQNEEHERNSSGSPRRMGKGKVFVQSKRNEGDSSTSNEESFSQLSGFEISPKDKEEEEEEEHDRWSVSTSEDEDPENRGRGGTESRGRERQEKEESSESSSSGEED